MAVRLSALYAGRPIATGIFLVLISVRGWVDPSAIVRLEGLRQLNRAMTSLETEPEIFHPQATALPRVTYRHGVHITKAKIKFFLYLIKQHAMKTYGEWRYSSTMLDLDIRQRWVASFRSSPLYHRCRDKNNLLSLQGIEPRLSIRSPIAIPTKQKWSYVYYDWLIFFSQEVIYISNKWKYQEYEAMRIHNKWGSKFYVLEPGIEVPICDLVTDF
jgi:hypothetical protein